jgi:hypothetical protein
VYARFLEKDGEGRIYIVVHIVRGEDVVGFKRLTVSFIVNCCNSRRGTSSLWSGKGWWQAY